jgi:MFS family permease
MLSALSSRDYRLLWFGQTIALLGDQFHLIALPWLVLQLTGDPLQLGLVLAVAGIARSGCMLLGGALADRFTPRNIMIWANIVRGAVAAALSAVVLGGSIEMWMVYVAAAAFGVITGIFEPSSQAAVPRLVPDEQLESGNSLVFFGDQLASFLGPAAAGALIGWFGASAAGAGSGSLTGIGAAFAVHAATFAVSIAFLAFMGGMRPSSAEEHAHPLRAIAAGIRYVTARSDLLWTLGLIASANLFITGPLMVGVPVLADTRLPEGPAALGMVLSGFAFGNLIGVGLAGSLRRPSPRMLGMAVIGLFGAFSLGLSAFALLESTWVAVPIMAVMGVGNGFLGVTVFTHLQRATPADMIGRVMSLLMLAMFAVMPLSQALAGALIKTSVESLFLVAGAGMALTGLIAASRPEIRNFGEERVVAPNTVEPCAQALIAGE